MRGFQGPGVKLVSRAIRGPSRVGEAEGDKAAGFIYRVPGTRNQLHSARQLFRTNNYGKSRDWCRVSDRMHYIQCNQIVSDAEIANVIPSAVREHRLTGGEIEKGLLELRIPRAANVAWISVGLEFCFSRIDAEHAIANGA